MNRFNQFDLGNAPLQFRVKLVQLAYVKVTGALLLLQKVGRRDYDSNAYNFLVEWNKPGPMIFAGVKYQGVILVQVTACTIVPHCINNL